jgi:hypothetical protein
LHAATITAFSRDIGLFEDEEEEASGPVILAGEMPLFDRDPNQNIDSSWSFVVGEGD